MTKKLLLFIFCFCSSFLMAQNQNSLSFDGIDDQVIVSGASALIANSNAITMSCWVYPTNTNPVFPNFDAFCGFRNEIDADFYMLQIGVGQVEARFRNSAGLNFDIVDNTMQANVWQQYTLVYSEPELFLYRNGSLVGSTAASGNIALTAETFYIGNLIYGVNNFNLTGKVDEVSLWNRALDVSEISCMQSHTINATSDSLKLYYDFNQGIAAGSNLTETVLIDRSLHLDGALDGFALLGFTSNFVPGIANSSSVVSGLCPGGSISFNGQTITTAGQYTASYHLAGICDSLVTLTVTVMDSSVAQNGNTLIANQAGALYQWVDCNNGFAPIAGAGQRSFTPVSDGSYACIIQQGSCTDTSGCRVVLIDAINSTNGNSSFRMYPNPAAQNVNFSLKNYNAGELTIRTISGQVVFKTNLLKSLLSVDLSFLPSGIYEVIVKTDNGISVAKLVH